MSHPVFPVLLGAALLAAVVCPAAAGPHDPYIYWLPSGSIDTQAEEFTVELRQTRMGVPDADLVLVRPAGQSQQLEVNLADETPWNGSFFVIDGSQLKDKESVEIRLSGPVPSCRFYLTRDFREVPDERRREFDAALEMRFAGRWAEAERAFRALGKLDSAGDLGRVCGTHARYCAYRQKSAQPGRDAGARYLLGLYCMENGFWEAAVDEFRTSVALDPANADAVYMLADSLAYRDGDNDELVEPLVPIYRRSAELRRVDPNVWNIYVGIFRKMWVDADDGKGGRARKLMEMSDDHVRRIQKEWAWTSDILWAASRGNLKLNNTVRVFDEEYDNTDPHAFDKLWKPGDQDVFLKFFEGGPADALGHDCGPNRSAVIDIGTWCGWEVFLHEWNHTLDWSMITSENGKGVPVTHSSDWCGYQPIPCMGRGHASLNHYYMTPGMFQTVKGSEPPTLAGCNTRWQIAGPFECEEGKGLDTEFAPEGVSGAADYMPCESPSGWVDLKAALKPSTQSVVGYARAWVFSPDKQKVRMWLGMNDGIRVWLNDTLVHRGIYKAIVLFDEANEPDQVVPSVVLQKGWNSILVKVENLPKTPEQLAARGANENGWGFSMRICDMRNRPIAGLKWSDSPVAEYLPPQAFPPASQRVHYRWEDVADDYTTLLPRLTDADLAAWSGLAGVSISPQCLISAEKPRQRGWAAEYVDPDYRLNNLLNWRFESAAVLRCAPENGATRDLVFLRPESIDTYLRLMRIPRGSGIASHADRVIGYVLADGLEDHPNGRLLLVVDTFLGDLLPLNEKDLLDISRL